MLSNTKTVSIEVSAAEAETLAKSVLALTVLGLVPRESVDLLISLCTKIKEACEREAAREVAEQTLSE